MINFWAQFLSLLTYFKILVVKSSNKSSSNSSVKSIGSTKFTYGCPPEFEKVSEYLCLHLGRNSTGHAKTQTFPQSEFYCRSRGNGANLVFLENLEDARALRKWIGNVFHAVISH